MNINNQKNKSKKNKLYIVLSLIFILDLFCLIFHFVEQDDEEKILMQLQANKNIKRPQQQNHILASQEEKNVLLRERLFIRQEYLITNQIKQLQKRLQFYDFLSLITNFQPKPEPEIVLPEYRNIHFKKKRNQLNIQLSSSQLKKMFQQMFNQNKNNQYNRITNQAQNKNYFYTLYNNPQNQIYLQLQFYYYHKVYKIGNFAHELPLCVVLYGRNNEQTIKQTFQSIHRQNYTNYRVVYLDDNSKDESINTVLQYLQNYKHLKNSVIVIKQHYQRNKLFNTNYGITNYCQDNDIIVEMNGNQFLIGKQVFQLVNTLYQSLNKKYQVWSVDTGSIKCQKRQCANSFKQKQISLEKPEKNFMIQSGLSVPRLRTYLKKIYMKIDSKDFIDSQMVKKRQFFTTGSQLFIYQRILQMGAQNHILRVQQSPYLYKYQPLSYLDIEFNYAYLSSKILRPYKPLKTLDQGPSRVRLLSNKIKLNQEYEFSKQKIKQRRLILANTIKKLYEESIRDNREKQVQYFDFVEKKQTHYKKKQFNSQFGKYPALIINVSSLLKKSDNFPYNDYGIYYDIQVCTNYDYFNITNKVNFSDVGKKLAEQAFHQVLTFTFNSNLQKTQQNIKFSYFQNYLEAQVYLNSSKHFNKDKKFIQDKEFFISLLLSFPNITKQAKQLEYFYLNKKYLIQNDFQEIPICIIPLGFNVFSQEKYKNLIYSLDKMNYTNFKVLWIDDNSIDNSAYNLYKYLKNKTLRIKNKIKIIRNFQYMGVLANIHIYTQKYCGQNDIVIICDAADQIIGLQTFHLLSSIFKNSNNSYVYSRFLKHSQQNSHKPIKRISSTKRYFQISSHLRIFRRQFIDKIPIQYLIQYKYNQNQQIVWPRYFQASTNSFFAYFNFSLSENSKGIFIDDILFKQNTSNLSSCYRYHELFEQQKSKLKRKLKQIKYLSIEYHQNQQISENLIKLKEYYKKYHQCSQ